MAFGRLGAMGGGFGRLGSRNNAAGAVAGGGAALLAGEANGLGIDFTSANDADRVAVKTAGAVVSSGLDAFFQNGGTSPKMVYDATGTLVWSAHNLFLNSASPATQSVTTVVGFTYTVTVTGTGTLTGSSGAAGVASAGSPLIYTATGVTSTFTLAGSLTQIQMNTGRVATAYLVTTGARRFGIAIDNDPVLGRAMLVEYSSINLCLWASDLTNAAWVKTTMTTALTATGPTGDANSATTITATGANATALQSITNASAARITSVFLKRRTGTGNVDITQDNGTTWATQAITSSWARYAIAEATVTNPVIGLRLATNGDAADVALFQQEVSSAYHVASSPCPTFSLSQTRTFDNYTFLLSTIPALASEYSIHTRFSIGNPTGSTQMPVVLNDGTTNERAGYILATNTLRQVIFDGGSNVGLAQGPAVSGGVFYSAAGRFKLNDMAVSVNGAAVVADTTVTMPTVSEARFGNAGANAGALNNFRISKLVIVTDRGWSDSELVAKSAS